MGAAGRMLSRRRVLRGMLNGSAVAYCIRQIITNRPLIKSRGIISLDEQLTPNYNSLSAKKSRSTVSKKFAQIFKLNES